MTCYSHKLKEELEGGLFSRRIKRRLGGAVATLIVGMIQADQLGRQDVGCAAKVQKRSVAG
jgi:hypothetical protein